MNGTKVITAGLFSIEAAVPVSVGTRGDKINEWTAINKPPCASYREPSVISAAR